LAWEAGRTSGLDPKARVLIAPDGMNALGGSVEPQPRFNLYTFTHWPQVDILAWFGGTADKTVVIPARPWIDAAHRNGVKVIGTVFFAPSAWGGSPDTVRALLHQRPDGSFPAADRLVEIGRFYGFDGWLINQETDVAPADGERMVRFMAYLSRAAPKPMEIHWYDAMLPNGQVVWQNELNRRNISLFQSGRRRASDGFYLNNQWTRAGLRSSAVLADRSGRTRYDLFVGADLWPRRDAQPAFRNTGWLDALRTRAGGPALGSIALFAVNFNYGLGSKGDPRFGDFQNNPADVHLFYRAEERLFAGDDLNMGEAGPGSSGSWPGISSLVPARSTVTALPFQTYFNTGHGLQDFRFGRRAGGAWHDMSRQDVLPTWQFAFSPGTRVKVGYDFERAYHGGSSLHIVRSGPSRSFAEVPLYLTRLPVDSAVSLTTVAEANSNLFSVRVRSSSGRSIDIPLRPSRGWRMQETCLKARPGEAIRRIAIAIKSGGGAAHADLLLGALALRRGCTEPRLQQQRAN
jgi:endo-beta-N-acetylglucosaminidase D